MRLRNYMFKASGTVENPEQAAAAMIENLNRGPESIVQHNCPDNIIVNDVDTVDKLEFVMDGDKLSGIRVSTHDWLIKGQKAQIREAMQMAADRAGRETGSQISVDGNMKYESTDENLPEHFYHLTERKSLDAIMKDGIVPKRGHNDWKSKNRCVYLTESDYIAPWLGILDHMDDPVVLEVATNKLPSVEQGRIWEDRDYVPGHVYSEHRTMETIPSDAIHVMSPDEVAGLGINERAIAQLMSVADSSPDTWHVDTKEPMRSGESEVKLCMSRLKDMGVMSEEMYTNAMQEFEERADSADFANGIGQMQGIGDSAPAK